MNDKLGQAAEKKIREWLDRPEDGYCFDRIPNRMTGFYGDNNICDFILFKSPEMYYIESKATWNDRFELSMLSKNQHDGLLAKSKIDHVHGWVIVLFASHQRAFIVDIKDIVYMETELNKHSLNITKQDKWPIPVLEIKTIPNSRKKLLDYDKDNVI